jgi:small-conductance mechanosensitive channel
MSTLERMNDRFIQTQRLYQILELETFILLTVLGILAFLFYRFFLKDVSQERHQNINTHLKALLKYFSVMTGLYFLYFLTSQTNNDSLKVILPYLGFLTFISGVVFFVKTSRLIVLQYLFLSSMRAGVPLLLVNIFSLALSIFISFWSVSVLFGFQLAPLLATSAAFSIILGLALQDTLGNLFAGISLQIDKTFEIGDWLEVMNGTIKIVGQVKELSWRSTALVGFSDEMITIPNKLMAQSQVSNFSPENTPILRSHVFKFPYGADPQKAIELLEQAASQISDIRGIPAPFAYRQDTSDYNFHIKIIYFIDNYGRQFVIGDKVYKTAFELLKKHGIEVARPTINVQQM